jgi:hypothetical protein
MQSAFLRLQVNLVRTRLEQLKEKELVAIGKVPVAPKGNERELEAEIRKL